MFFFIALGLKTYPTWICRVFNLKNNAWNNLWFYRLSGAVSCKFESCPSERNKIYIYQYEKKYYWRFDGTGFLVFENHRRAFSRSQLNSGSYFILTPARNAFKRGLEPVARRKVLMNTSWFSSSSSSLAIYSWIELELSSSSLICLWSRIEHWIKKSRWGSSLAKLRSA